MRRMLGVVLAVALAGVAASTLRGQGRARLEGVVRDGGGSPLAGVEVRVTGAIPLRRPRAVTDAAGRFVFTNLPAGRHEVTARLRGFTEVAASVTLAEGATERLALVMVPVAPPPIAPPAPVALGPAPTLRSDSAAQMSAATAPFASRRQVWPPFPRYNTETYDKIDDAQWADARQKPLSTFSIDVDTASYANVRRFLTGGTLPPKDAVRIEELINYFSYDYPDPRDGQPFSVTASMTESPWHPGYRLALIGLQARRIPSERMPPRNLVFLVDVSGSMQAPNKLPLVTASLAMLAQNLTARDRVAIVVYAGAAGVVLPPTRGDNRSAIIEALDRLQAGGSTNGAEGLQLAYDVARSHFAAGGVNRVVLATDGDFNVGVTSRGDLVRLIERQRDGGIALSVLGFGMGNLKDATMEDLADAGNGNYSYIDDLSEARKVLVEQAGGTLVTVAKDVKLQVEFNPAVVSAYRLIGYENRALDDRDFNDDRKDAGDLGAGHSVTALYELVPVGQHVDVPPINPLKYQQVSPIRPEAAGDESMTVSIRYKQPEDSRSALMTVPVSAGASMTPALGFAASVAAFGMLLRESEFKGTATFAAARALAETYRGTDQYGHRAEFARLIGIAESLVRPGVESRR